MILDALFRVLDEKTGTMTFLILCLSGRDRREISLKVVNKETQYNSKNNGKTYTFVAAGQPGSYDSYLMQQIDMRTGENATE